MKIYTIKRIQFLPVSLDKAWGFFSAPSNLELITPGDMGFHILYDSGSGVMYAGQLIQYRIRILPGVSTHWVTEITHLREREYFVDEQRYGPYALWHHQHHFREVAGGVEMTDIVNYAIPFGIIGRLVNRFFVRGRVNVIFDHRFEAVKNYFSREAR